MSIPKVFLLIVILIFGSAFSSLAEAEQLYTCGMHPNVIQDTPGTCPICGMNLTPMKTFGKAAAKKGAIKYWVAPMDPTYISDKPGKSPMGMDLVPVYEDGGAPDSKGTVTVDPVMVQNMGVRVAPVERGVLTRKVRVVGEVEVAETKLSVVNLRFSGWIEKIHVDETGVFVKRGQALFSIYSPEIVAAQDEYLLAIKTAGKDSPLARSAKRRLEYWDLGKWLIKKIEKQNKASRLVTITAPRAGYVIHKNVVQGSRVNAGADLYRIGDLSSIWVRAEIYEFDAPWIILGQPATMELAFQAGKQYRGKVDYIYPTLNPKSRTLSVRLEFPNPNLNLKPGMFTTVRIETRRKEDVLNIPTEAIIHSGERQIVFVAKGVGRYEPREIVTGLFADGRKTEILSGLKQGEQVVTSGQFLLDSESQIQEAVQKLLAARLQIKAVQTKNAEADSGGEKTWTCSMHPMIAQDEPGTCPICGMDLVEKDRDKHDND